MINLHVDASSFQLNCNSTTDDSVAFPDDIVGLFLKCLKYDKIDFIKCSLVSRAWNKITEYERIDRINAGMIQFEVHPRLTTEKAIVDFAKVYGNRLKTVFLVYGVSQNAFNELINLTPNLSKLGLQGQSWFNVEAIVKLNQLSSLTDLNLNFCMIEDSLMPEVGKLTNLTSLDLTFSKVTDRGLADLTQLTKLSSLNLSDCDIKGPGLAHLTCLTNLSNLNLSCCSFHDCGWYKNILYSDMGTISYHDLIGRYAFLWNGQGSPIRD